MPMNTPVRVDEARLLHETTAALPQLLADIETLVQVETPSKDTAAVARGASVVADLVEQRLGRRPETLEIEGTTHLRLRLGAGPTRVLLLCHQDTVWPTGTLARIPFSNRDGVLRGPGVYDMLTGTVMAIHALVALRDQLGLDSLDGVVLLVTGDEEIGSPTSQDLIRDEARGANAVYVLESSYGPDGAIKTARKGVALYTVTVHGRAAHAGLEPHLGINAGLEVAAMVRQVADFADPQQHTSVVPTRLGGGTTTNTVPERAWFDIDSRAWTVAEQQRVDQAIRALHPEHPQARIEISGGINRAPFEAEMATALADQAFATAARLGVELPPEPVAVGGGSDGNFTAGIGVPTLDGLGAVGGGAHAESEHALVAPIAGRTALLASLIAQNLNPDEVSSSGQPTAR